MDSTTAPVAGVDWADHWQRLVAERAAAASDHTEPGFWDRRAPAFARSTRKRVDDFLEVIEP